MTRSIITFRFPTDAMDGQEVSNALGGAQWSQVGESLRVGRRHTEVTGAIDKKAGPDVIKALQALGVDWVPDEQRRTGPSQVTYGSEPREPAPVQEHLHEKGPVIALHKGRWHFVMNGDHPGMSGTAKPKERRATHLADIVTNERTPMTRVESRPARFAEIERYAKDRAAYDRTDEVVRNAELGFARSTQGAGPSGRETAWVDRTKLGDVYDALAEAGRNPSSPGLWRGRAHMPHER